MEKRTWSTARFQEATDPSLDDLNIDEFETPSVPVDRLRQEFWGFPEGLDGNVRALCSKYNLSPKAFPDWSLRKIYDAADVASKTHPDLEGLLGVIPTFMRDEGIPEDEIPHRDWLAEIEESVEVENVDDYEAPSQPPIAASCGVCGAPLDAEGNYIENIPEGYNPDNYEHTYCPDCGNKEREEHRFQVTHEMALDAGDPSLEGTWW